MLDRNISVLKNNPEIRFVLEGYSDKRGNKSYNKELAKKRVEAVEKYLIEKGIELNRIVSKVVVGSTDKFAQGNSEESLWLNRRVRFVLLEKKRDSHLTGTSESVSSSLGDLDSNQKIRSIQLQEPVVSQPTTEKDLLNIRREVARYIRYKIPQEMTEGVGSVVTVGVRRSLFDYLNDLKLFGIELGVSEKKLDIYIEGDDFKITDTPLPSGVSKSDNDTIYYAWNVVPLESGVQTLILGIGLKGEMNDLYFPIYERVVQVYPFIRVF